ncbi:MAG TPA: oxidoreductase [Cytophagales bacterium]|nr:oxidoreductase [Cytophagales bacterium]
MKNMFIIGGSSGIGKALTNQLASTEKVFSTFFKNAPSSSHENIRFQQLNVLEESNDYSFLPETLHGLVYCPGAINLKPFLRTKPQDFIEDYKLQVIGAVNCIQACLPNLKKSENASIVLFSTVAVQMGFNFHSIVSASKGAIEGLTKALAAELAPNIRVNCIAPSITLTPLAANLLNSPEKIEANAQRHPLKKIGTAEDIAQMAAFLLSEESKWMTGQILHLDGGMSSIKM